MRTKSSSGYIPTLDGWRAIAIILVFINHIPLSPNIWTPHGNSIIGYGNLGVDLFFAISGLLICSRLLAEEARFGHISLRNFYIRRTFRIFPPAYLYLFVLCLLSAASVIPADWPSLASGFLFVRNYFMSLVRDTIANRMSGHFWSLAIEEHFYLVLPAILFFFRKSRKTVLLGLTIGAFLWLIIYLRITPSAERSIYWERRTDLRIAALFFPAWLALLLNNPSTRERFKKVLLPRRVIIVAALLFTTLAAASVHRHRHASTAVHPSALAAHTIGLNDSAPRGGDAHPMIQFVAPLTFPFLILATVLYPESLVGRVLEWNVLRGIGRVSYSLYIWQMLFWEPRYTGWPIANVQGWIGLPISIGCALLSYFFLEKPLIRLGHRLAPPPNPGHADL